MRVRAGFSSAIVGLAVVAGLLAPAAAEVSDTISIVKDGEESLTNVEIAARLSDETRQQTDMVLIGRNDVFVDAMTSGLLQADSPLLLVPPEGPVPQRVRDELAELSPTEVVLLGGAEALGPAVEVGLVQDGYTVSRTFGPSRFETATAIADRGAAPDVDTVIVARAFADPLGSDDTQAFADALAAGGWAAEERWPILLTQTEVLTGATRSWLEDHDVHTAFVLGGTAAVSADVEAELASLVGTVERVAGPDRFGTAVAVAKKRGADSAAQAVRVTLVEGQGDEAWAGGFAAAAHSAVFDAPIVLSNGSDLPQATSAWLSGEAAASGQLADHIFTQQPGGVRLTCVTPFPACLEARELLGLPDLVTITFDPPDGSEVERDSTVTVTVQGQATGFDVSGSCTTGTVSGVQGSAQVTVTATDACELLASVSLAGGSVQTEAAGYTIVQLVPPADEDGSGGGTPPTGPPAPAVDEILFLTLPIAGRFAQVPTAQVGKVGIDGTGLLLADCNSCSQLRLAPDGSSAVVVRSTAEGSSLALLRPDDLGVDGILVAADAAARGWSHPQFTPDSGTVVAGGRSAEGVDTVYRIDLDDGQLVPIASGWRLAGPDAVGPAGGVESGVGAVVHRSGDGFGQSGAIIGLVDVVSGADVEVIDETLDGAPTAAMHPEGRGFALSDQALARISYYEFDGTVRSTAANEEPVVVPSPVWMPDGTTIAGVDRAGEDALRQVRVVVTPEELLVVGDDPLPGLWDPRRAGVYDGDELLVGLRVSDQGQDVHRLATGLGRPIADLPIDVGLFNPHRIP